MYRKESLVVHWEGLKHKTNVLAKVAAEKRTVIVMIRFYKIFEEQFSRWKTKNCRQKLSAGKNKRLMGTSTLAIWTSRLQALVVRRTTSAKS